MKYALLLLSLLFAAASSPGSLAITFIDLGNDSASLSSLDRDAWLDVRTMSAQGGRKKQAARVRKQIGIRITRADNLPIGSARVEARLDSTDGRSKVWIDGRQLGLAPVIVDAHARVGSVIPHRIDIEVPQSVPDGPIASSIEWKVTTE